MIVLETLGRRWFAFGFVGILLWAAWPEGGAARSLRFLAIAATLSFVAEYASTHTSIPYGRYDYVAATRGMELYLSNVPLFVPLSFGVVVFAGRALALGLARSRTSVVLLGAAFAVLLDAAIDPVTVRGSAWFLGDLYRFRHGGAWFGVPWSNAAGWLVVSAAIVALDGVAGRATPSERSRRRGVALAIVVCAFAVTVALTSRLWSVAGTAAGIGVVVAVAGSRRHAAVGVS